MQALVAALRTATSLDIRPEGVIIQRNVGGYFHGVTPDEEHISWRGFNLILLDRAGRPAFYAKCRPKSSVRAVAERRLLLGLASDPLASRTVPSTQELEWGGLGILLMKFIDGPTLKARFPGLDAGQRRAVFTGVLDLSASLVQRASEIGLLARRDGCSAVESGMQDVVAWLRDFLTAQQAEELSRCIGIAGQMAPVPQHGDLTSGNVMMRGHEPVLIDLEGFGGSTLPFADAWSLARSLPRQVRRAGDRVAWWRGDLAALVIDQARQSLAGSREAWATLPVYVAQQAGLLSRRGVPAEFVVSIRSELQRLLQDRLDDPAVYR